MKKIMILVFSSLFLLAGCESTLNRTKEIAHVDTSTFKSSKMDDVYSSESDAMKMAAIEALSERLKEQYNIIDRGMKATGGVSYDGNFVDLANNTIAMYNAQVDVVSSSIWYLDVDYDAFLAAITAIDNNLVQLGWS